MDLTIAKQLQGLLPRLKTKEDSIIEWETAFPYQNIYPLVEKATYLGIECEIENCTINKTITDPIWEFKKDGSLRNNGLEAITPPIKASRIESALWTLFTKRLNPGYEYSDRCSTHVHMNVRTLTEEQLKSLVLTYMVFEKALFHWVGHNRNENIYCVPLHEIKIANQLLPKLSYIPHLTWSKYTALNLKPITSMGTIEFRHLEGTNNILRIITWINFLLSLKKFSLQNRLDTILDQILSMNTISNYLAFVNQVFPEKLGEELYYPELEEGMSFCISNIKASCLLTESKVTVNKLHKLVLSQQKQGEF